MTDTHSLARSASTSGARPIGIHKSTSLDGSENPGGITPTMVALRPLIVT